MIELFMGTLLTLYVLEILFFTFIFLIVPVILDYVTINHEDSYVVTIQPKTKNARAFLVLSMVVFPWIIAALVTSI